MLERTQTKCYTPRRPMALRRWRPILRLAQHQRRRRAGIRALPYAGIPELAGIKDPRGDNEALARVTHTARRIS